MTQAAIGARFGRASLLTAFYGLSASLLLFPTAASAQSCYTLQQQSTNVQQQMASLIANYPGTHIVIGMCAAGASGTLRRTGNQQTANNEFAACALIGCALAGFQNCIDVAASWFTLSVENDRIRARLRNC